LNHSVQNWWASSVRVVMSSSVTLMRANKTRQGRPLDGLLAATALCHGLDVATRNEKDFADLGVEVLNPWEAA
jgi:predicted nucleic acid-binding protein